MPYIETVDDLAEWLANQIGIWDYGVPIPGTDGDGAHATECPCRRCWTRDVKTRLRHAAAHEHVAMALTVHDTLDATGRLVTSVTADGYSETLTRTPQETRALLRTLAHGLGYGLVPPQDAIPYDSTTLTPAQIAAATGTPTWLRLPTREEEVLRPGVLNGTVETADAGEKAAPAGGVVVGEGQGSELSHGAESSLKRSMTDSALPEPSPIMVYESFRMPQEPTTPPGTTPSTPPPLQPCWAALQARLRTQGVERTEAECREACARVAIPPDAQAEAWQEALGRAVPVLARAYGGRA